MEKIIQVQVSRGANHTPSITALTSDGRIYDSWTMGEMK